jgi:hypothetical protein
MISASNASHALGAQAIQLLDAVRSQRVRALESLLDRAGLQRRRGALRPVLFVVVGAVAAGVVVLVLAPTSGKALRARIRDVFRSAKDQVRADVGKPERTAFEQRVHAVVGESNGSVDGVSRSLSGG